MAKRHRKKQKQTETKPKYPDAALIRRARANAAIEKMTTIKATTMAGLVAKASAMQFILDDDNGGMEERSEVFYRAFEADGLPGANTVR